jgi:hypothetical protein
MTITPRICQVFFESKALTKMPEIPLSIRTFSSMLIALHLMHIKYGKKFTVISNEVSVDQGVVTREEQYIAPGIINEDVTTVKGFLTNVLGKFLLMSTAGAKQYDYEILTQKLERSQMELLVKSVFLILNAPWKEAEIEDRDVLLLNSLYYTLGERILDESVLNLFISNLEKVETRSLFVLPEYSKSFKVFKDEILEYYLSWLEKFKDPAKKKSLITTTDKLSVGKLIFISKIGFNKVEGVNIHNGVTHFSLSRAGYPFNGSFLNLEQIQYGLKCITYR